jgi:hypothetical protein
MVPYRFSFDLPLFDLGALSAGCEVQFMALSQKDCSISLDPEPLASKNHPTLELMG